MPALALDSIPALWRASDLSVTDQPVVGSGYPSLDAELPGGGWPSGQLNEVLQAEAHWREWRLLSPALATLSRRGAVLLVGPPLVPNLPALAAMGLAIEALRWVRASSPAERLWAAEQGLRCRDLAALLVWLPSCSAQSLRRLHLAAQAGRQPQPPLLWAMRPWQSRLQASPAALRLGLRAGVEDGLEVLLFKRRGPTLERPLWLAAARPAALRPRPDLPAPVTAPVSGPRPRLPDAEDRHVVDRALARPFA